MELEFIQNETGKWVAEFQVTSDFNLHLDNVNKRSLKILQKTQGNGYGIVADTLEVRDYTNVYDCDFTGLVYPKFIRIESGEKPYGIITTDGEVTEIKSQSKEVEITSNGVTEIAPDAGFGYLSGVKVNVNVPQSGGSGGGNMGEENTAEFLDISSLSGEVKTAFARFAILGAVVATQGNLSAKIVCPPYFLESQGGVVPDQIKINFKEKVIHPGVSSNIISLEELLMQAFQMPADYIASIPRITEEEFYNLES